MDNLTLAERIQHVTCLIRSETGSGTGFVFELARNGNSTFPLLVTNRHVIEGAKDTSFDMTLANKDGGPDFGKKLTFEVQGHDWFHHPNPHIDLAAIPLGGMLTEAVNQNCRPFFIPLEDGLIAEDEYLRQMDAIENIVMVGYPTGVFDQENNLPVTRRGITASRIGLKYNGRPEFLIDCACFPGSSGSPIFQFDTGPELRRDGGMSMGGVRFKFLGVLWGGPTYNVSGQLVAVPIQTSVMPVPRTTVMTNLGFCIRASQVREFKSIFAKDIEHLTSA